MLLASSVLSLRGNSQSQVTKQPLEDDLHSSGNILLWNGELFSSEKNFVQVESHENDGLKILHKLSENFEKKTERDILNVFESIKGPFAFIFYEKLTNSVYFGRDRLGRRSLLINSLNRNDLNHNVSTNNNNSLLPVVTISSVQVKTRNDSSSPILNDFQELKANRIYKLNLNSIINSNENYLDIFNWKNVNQQSINAESIGFIEIENFKVNNFKKLQFFDFI